MRLRTLAKERANEQEDPTIEVPINDVRTICTETWKKQKIICMESQFKEIEYFSLFYKRKRRKP